MNIKFSNIYQQNQEDYLLFEVDEDILDSLQNETQFIMRGCDVNDNAIIHSTQKSYKIKENYISNSLLVLNKSNRQQEYTLEEIIPDVSQLYKRLLAKKITELGQLDFILENCDTYQDILNTGIINRKQLFQFLESIPVALINERLIFLDYNLCVDIFQNILQLVHQQNINIEQFTLNQISEKLNIPGEIIEGVLLIGGDKNEDKTYRITYSNICKMLLLEILLAKSEMLFNEIQEIYEKMESAFVPYEMLSEIDKEIRKQTFHRQLRKLAIIIDENDLSQQYYLKKKVKVKYIDINILPIDDKIRLEQLQKIKKYYFSEELLVYMNNIYTDKNITNQFIIKNTKFITELIHKTSLDDYLDVHYIYSKAISENKFDKKTFCAKFLIVKY